MGPVKLLEFTCGKETFLNDVEVFTLHITWVVLNEGYASFKDEFRVPTKKITEISDWVEDGGGETYPDECESTR